MKLDRRKFLATTVAASAALVRGAYTQNGAESSTDAEYILEFDLQANKTYTDPTREVLVDARVTGPGGSTYRVPAFWAGGRRWKWRFPAVHPGQYRFDTIASQRADAGLHGVDGSFEVARAPDSASLFARGGLRVSADRRHLESVDGAPFFWLGDTWWMGLTRRLRWPEEFRELVADRVAKGFNVVQLVAGLYPEMDSFDARGANEAGFPWTDRYGGLNPAWWDLADQRIRHLVRAGLTPCILGCWGYYLLKLGIEDMQRHWRTVIARWGAYPVVWCLAGEGSMPWYLTTAREEERADLAKGWTELARFVRKTDPFARMITMHPSRAGRDEVQDAAVLDFDMLQTGHGDYRSIENTLTVVTDSYRRQPIMPVVQAEVCYEGIMGHCREEIQRFMLWSSILNGCCGFTYGANGIWQVNRPEDPFGRSPFGHNWGNTPWREAMRLPGGRQLGLAARLLRELPWHQMTPHPEWISPNWEKDGFHNPSAAGIPGRFRIFYTPTTLSNPPRLQHLERDIRYRMRLWNPSDGGMTDAGEVIGGLDGTYALPHFPEQRDWVILLEA